MISLAAAIASLTSCGAATGAAARPVGRMVAVCSGVSCVAAGLGWPYAAPPVGAGEVVVATVGAGVLPEVSVPAAGAWAPAAGAAASTATIVVTRAKARKVESSFVGLRGYLTG